MPKTDLKAKYEAMSVYERDAWLQGYTYIAGMDEAGRGPLAGPVVAAAVILDPENPVYGVDDSKKLSPARRQALKKEIEEKAVAVSVGMADVETIDRINILEATKLAMKRAVEGLAFTPEIVLVDAVKLDLARLPEVPIIKGDACSYSIAAASIVAKVTRDHQMIELDKVYPEYGFARNKGYGTAEHIEALRKYGPCPLHRRTFIGHFL